MVNYEVLVGKGWVQGWIYVDSSKLGGDGGSESVLLGGSFERANDGNIEGVGPEEGDSMGV